MDIFVDADACPVVRIVERIAKKYNIAVTLLCDTNHVLFISNNVLRCEEKENFVMDSSGGNVIFRHKCNQSNQ